MKLTIRTPYKTLLENCEEFSRIKGRTQSGSVNIQNRTPASIYVLPPGPLTVKLNKEIEGFSGELFHSGAFITVHPDNSCEIALMEAFEKSELRVDQLGAWDMPDEENEQAVKFVNRIREKTKNTFAKKLV